VWCLTGWHPLLVLGVAFGVGLLGVVGLMWTSQVYDGEVGALDHWDGLQ